MPVFCYRGSIASNRDKSDMRNVVTRWIQNTGLNIPINYSCYPCNNEIQFIDHDAEPGSDITVISYSDPELFAKLKEVIE